MDNETPKEAWFLTWRMFFILAENVNFIRKLFSIIGKKNTSFFLHHTYVNILEAVIITLTAIIPEELRNRKF